MMRIENLSKNYGKKQVLKNINITFKAGQVYGIVGENGAGKTTLFKCIATIEKFEGLIKSEQENLKNYLGFLTTEPFFFDKITGEEYIKFLANVRNKRLNDINENNIFDLPLKQYAATYSTGMKKKLALTAILLQGNDLFILDEPFNGVDIQSNIIIVALINKLKQLGKTVIISSHIFSTLAETCDEIHILKQGELVKGVLKKDFAMLESEMKEFTIGDRIENFDFS